MNATNGPCAQPYAIAIQTATIANSATKLASGARRRKVSATTAAVAPTTLVTWPAVVSVELPSASAIPPTSSALEQQDLEQATGHGPTLPPGWRVRIRLSGEIVLHLTVEPPPRSSSERPMAARPPVHTVGP